jgi:hypothetical protein
VTVEEWIGRALATIADDLRPQPATYECLMVRRRRARRRRTVIGAVLCLVLAATIVGIVS